MILILDTNKKKKKIFFHTLHSHRCGLLSISLNPICQDYKGFSISRDKSLEEIQIVLSIPLTELSLIYHAFNYPRKFGNAEAS